MGYTIEAHRADLEELSTERLIDEIINTRINGFVGSNADWDKDEDHPDERTSRVPYIGWFWRNVDFAGRYIPIGNCGSFIGFMENNKWDYPQRDLTDEEVDQVMALIYKAMDADSGGGLVSDIIAATNGHLDALWELFQTFPLSTEGFWIYGIQGRVAHADSEQEADEMIAMLSAAGPGFNYRKEKA